LRILLDYIIYTNL